MHTQIAFLSLSLSLSHTHTRTHTLSLSHWWHITCTQVYYYPIHLCEGASHSKTSQALPTDLAIQSPNGSYLNSLAPSWRSRFLEILTGMYTSSLQHHSNVVKVELFDAVVNRDLHQRCDVVFASQVQKSKRIVPFPLRRPVW